MSNPLVDRLQAVARLSPPELAAVESLTASTRMAAPKEVLLAGRAARTAGVYYLT